MRYVWTNLYIIECMQGYCDVQVILQVSEWVHHDDGTGHDMHKERHSRKCKACNTASGRGFQSQSCS